MRTLFGDGVAVALFLGLSCSASAQVGNANYNGNGAAGFGGPIGDSTLNLSYDTATGVVSGSLTTGVNFSGNALVLYLDTVSGGINNTSTLADAADGGRTAISGLNGDGRTQVNFAPGFGADFAISLEPGVFGGLFNLSTPSNFGFVGSVGLAGGGTGPFTFSFNVSQVGLSSASPATFSFVGSLISTTAYRSNETIGTSVTVPGTPGDTPNAGFTGSQTFANSNTFTTFVAAPEPGSFALAGLALVPGAIVLRRRTK